MLSDTNTMAGTVPKPLLPFAGLTAEKNQKISNLTFIGRSYFMMWISR